MKAVTVADLTLLKRLAMTLVPAVISIASFAQQPAAKTVPHLVNFSGTVSGSGSPRSGIVGLTFALYKDEAGGSPLWLETQSAQLDSHGRYSVQLGATKPDGLPIDLFLTADAHWLGVTVAGQPEQPRVLLVSVPYALKAADADTIGGRPASAFVLAPTPDVSAAAGASPIAASSAALPPALTGTGTTNFVPLWTPDGNTLGNSVLFQSGSGITAKLGINTTTPTSTLDVKGTATVRGIFSLPAGGVATATAGKNSQAQSFTASAFSSATSTAVNQSFRLQAEPAGNNTPTASGTLNLLFGQGTATPAETGLKIASNGRITFAAGQTFPGTGSGTVQSVAFTAPASDFNVSGSPVTSTGTLGLTWSVPPTSANTANAIVKRDANGAIAAGLINGASYFDADLVPAIYGYAQGSTKETFGVFGFATSPNGVGVFGRGVGFSTMSYTFPPGGGTGVWGDTSASGGIGVKGYADDGVALYGLNSSPVFATLSVHNFGGGDVLIASGQNGGCRSDSAGNLFCNGTLNGALKNFRLDHPLDPANKYLNHSSVESSEMLNLYTGNTVLGADGSARVTVPAWFTALNCDFRYQLTPIGGFAPLYIAEELNDNHFAISGGRPGMKVSWQVTAVRHDPYAEAHALVVEEDKSASDRGRYEHPELYGQPKEKGILSRVNPPIRRQATSTFDSARP